jgi:hypothetical protein
MVGGRGLPIAACLCLAAGCAVIDATDDDLVEAHCEPIVANAFDDTARWEDYSEPGASVERARDAVHITSAPSEEEFGAYADLHSKAVLGIVGTELEAEVTVPEPDAVAGISWTRDDAELDEDQDYYDLIIDSGTLVPIRREVGGEDTALCPAECRPYDPVAHAFLRLRASGVDVLYEVSAGGGDWTEVARAPRAEKVYRAIAYVYAEAPGTSELSVTRMEWAACER